MVGIGLLPKLQTAAVAGAFTMCLSIGCGGNGGHPGVGGGGNTDGGGQGQPGADLGGNPGTPMTVNNVFISWYGFNDNSCQVETDHNCNTIGFAKMDGFPTAHDIATEGKGTYDDPNTFATGAMDSGSPAEIAPGTLIYVPLVHKYFIMEDQCAECGMEWFSKMSWHVDLWMGPSYGSATTPLVNCENTLTVGDTYAGTGTIIVNPPSNLPVDTSPLFSNDTCTAHTYSN
jgi:hypothetical protein